mgnify:FL=1|tara:strand:- start:150 stop:404 length:255 start_codon:yes stop_codon:yes gene_type:complete
MVKKTVKELTEELKISEEMNAKLKVQFDELMSQAQGLQQLAANRLVFIRLMEGFSNEVNSSLQKLQRDVVEIQGPQQDTSEVQG